MDGNGQDVNEPDGGHGPEAFIVDLDGFDGQTVNVRWRAVSDSNTAASTPLKGMYIDNIKVEACQ